MDSLASRTASYALRYTSSYFTLRHSLSMNTLSAYLPRPSMLLQGSREGLAGELTPLVRVEYLRLTPLQGLLQG